MSLTKGIIRSIDYTANTCVVRLPVFETAGTKTEFTATAIFSIPPGVYNGYQVDDVVVVGFGTGGWGDAAILGKLYLGAAKEKASIGGAMHCADAVIDNSVTLPSTVKLGFVDGNSGTAVKTGDVKSISSYQTLAALAQAVAESEAAIEDLESETHSFSSLTQEYGTWLNGETVYKRTVSTTTDQTTVTAVRASTCWIDLSHSFIQGSDGNTRSITDYSIKLGSGNKISVSGLSLNAGETAYLTLLYFYAE